MAIKIKKSNWVEIETLPPFWKYGVEGVFQKVLSANTTYLYDGDNDTTNVALPIGVVALGGRVYNDDDGVWYNFRYDVASETFIGDEDLGEINVSVVDEQATYIFEGNITELVIDSILLLGDD